MIDIDKIDVNDDIKKSLRDISKSIQITKDSSKGGNGYLFFGDDRILARKVAIKYYYWGGQKKYHAEPNQLSQLKSENIIKIFTANYAGDEWAYFVTPFCTSGDLDDIIESQRVNKTTYAIDLTLGILNGLCALHSTRFVHRDLKPANVFVTDSRTSVIGDFGSLKKLSYQNEMAAGSGHSTLYRPPESINSSSYGIQGDLYQVGIILYQLLGGHFPYEEISWLNKKERRQYSTQVDPFEKSKIIDEALKRKIISGRVLDLSSLPLHVEKKLKRVIRNATNSDTGSRYKSAPEFMADLKKAKEASLPWVLLEGYWSTDTNISYRFREVEKGVLVEKKIKAGWRKDGGFKNGSIDEAIKYIRKNTNCTTR